MQHQSYIQRPSPPIYVKAHRTVSGTMTVFYRFSDDKDNDDETMQCKMKFLENPHQPDQQRLLAIAHYWADRAGKAEQEKFTLETPTMELLKYIGNEELSGALHELVPHQDREVQQERSRSVPLKHHQHRVKQSCHPVFMPSCLHT